MSNRDDLLSLPACKLTSGPCQAACSPLDSHAHPTPPSYAMAPAGGHSARRQIQGDDVAPAWADEKSAMDAILALSGRTNSVPAIAVAPSRRQKDAWQKDLVSNPSLCLTSFCLNSIVRKCSCRGDREQNQDNARPNGVAIFIAQHQPIKATSSGGRGKAGGEGGGDRDKKPFTGAAFPLWIVILFSFRPTALRVLRQNNTARPREAAEKVVGQAFQPAKSILLPHDHTAQAEVADWNVCPTCLVCPTCSMPVFQHAPTGRVVGRTSVVRRRSAA